MTNTEFQYWIEGYLSLSKESKLYPEQVRMIKNHAHLVQTTLTSSNLSAIHFSSALENELKCLKLVPRPMVEKLARQILGINC